MTTIGQEISIKETKMEERNHTGYTHLDTKGVSIKKKELNLFNNIHSNSQKNRKRSSKLDERHSPYRRGNNDQSSPF